MENKIRKQIIDKIGITYFWYLTVLLDTIDYSNRVEFWILKDIWVSEWMTKFIRKKLKDSGIIKKIGTNFFLDPSIRVKWDMLPPFVVHLFNNK
jgi:hypothetical protein